MISASSALSLFSTVAASSYEEISKLSQLERKICLKSAELLLSKMQKPISLPCFKGLSLQSFHERVGKMLVAVKAKRCWLIRLIHSIVKGILNFFNLRVSTKKLFSQIALLKKDFFGKYWNQYVKNHFLKPCVQQTAFSRLVFLERKAPSFSYQLFQRNCFAKYGVKKGSGKNCVLMQSKKDYSSLSKLKGSEFEFKELWDRSLYPQETEERLEMIQKALDKIPEDLSRFSQKKRFEIIHRKIRLENQKALLDYQQARIFRKQEKAIYETLDQYTSKEGLRVFLIADPRVYRMSLSTL